MYKSVHLMFPPFHTDKTYRIFLYFWKDNQIDILYLIPPFDICIHSNVENNGHFLTHFLAIFFPLFFHPTGFLLSLRSLTIFEQPFDYRLFGCSSMF